MIHFIQEIISLNRRKLILCHKFVPGLENFRLRKRGGQYDSKTVEQTNERILLGPRARESA